ncbi:cytidine deaminase [Croceitalea sp. MTPC9]|uniref:cytidine deaminase n=1 Tax=unclassified Croceitalea TaxID=2632280 RepID=UPI002B39EC29|nr:cytidine deaminase [Croceitalea sp. MTPC6]GMN17757.1 cytidine deaminase [Croceitalea sp. MTPC9]
MEKRNIGFELSIYDSENELTQAEAELLSKAVKARYDAYAPYSNFQVGAAVLLESGEVVVGNNQENASYPSGLCAERVAIFQAGARFPDQRILAIAISAASKNYVVDCPAGPCGNCRQSIAEYEQKQKTPIIMIMRGEKGKIYKCNSIAELLPLAFNNSFLGDS